jgi:arginase
MPLSAALGEDNLDCQINEITRNVKALGRHENIGTPGTKIRPENLIYFEFVILKRRRTAKLKKLESETMVDEVRYRGPNWLLTKLSNCDLIFFLLSLM